MAFLVFLYRSADSSAIPHNLAPALAGDSGSTGDRARWYWAHPVRSLTWINYLYRARALPLLSGAREPGEAEQVI